MVKGFKQKKVNIQFLLIVLTLFVFGLLGLYSASTVESYKVSGGTTYYILHQLIFGGVVGLILMYIFSKIDYHFWQKKLPLLLLLSLILLIAVKIPGLGLSSGGASRWIDFRLFSFQPVELAKLVIIIYLASWADKKRKNIKSFYFGLLPSLAIVGLFSLLLLWQPDFGTMFVILSVAMAMFFVSGVKLKHLFWLVLTGILGLVALIKFEPYRARRFTTFFNPNFDPQGISYQINQALLAIGAGGFWGYGYGLSRQKYNYLPEVMGDSIFAVLAEELGFIRILIILALFIIFALKGYKIAKRAPDVFGKVLAFGITTWVVFQVIINIGAMVNILPLTGITLPFFSYGSSSLIMTLGAMGIILNISRYSNKT